LWFEVRFKTIFFGFFHHSYRALSGSLAIGFAAIGSTRATRLGKSKELGLN
jgi:hypothetical protein